MDFTGQWYDTLCRYPRASCEVPGKAKTNARLGFLVSIVPIFTSILKHASMCLCMFCIFDIDSCLKKTKPILSYYPNSKTPLPTILVYSSHQIKVAKLPTKNCL